LQRRTFTVTVDLPVRKHKGVPTYFSMLPDASRKFPGIVSL
jgi:hypothetical protein